jgi:hypothetical protein
LRGRAGDGHFNEPRPYLESDDETPTDHGIAVLEASAGGTSQAGCIYFDVYLRFSYRFAATRPKDLAEMR